MVINVDQNQFACEPETTPGTTVIFTTEQISYDTLCSVLAFNGCPFEIDSVWDIIWPKNNLCSQQN